MHFFTVCSGFRKAVKVAISSLGKPFYNSISSFRNPFNKGFEPGKSSGFFFCKIRQISKRFHSEKEKFNFIHRSGPLCTFQCPVDF